MARKGKQRRLRIALVAVVLLLVGSIGGLGWHWVTSIRCTQIDLSGARHAERTALLELAQVDTGMVLFDIDPRLVADRMRRHPWVREASATRLPTGTLALHVEERTPVALVVDGAGRPAMYLDRFGFPMPLVPAAAYNVPLLRGFRERLHPVQPVEHATVRALLEALAVLDAETDALISEIAIQPSGEAWLYTTPAFGRDAIPVRLGRGPFARKLARLKAFWHQAVLTQPDKHFEQVDLRFDSQIVTREAAGR